MKIVLTGSKEFLAQYVRDFFTKKGHEVLLVHRFPEKNGEISFDQIKTNAFPDCDLVINFPETQLLNRKKGIESYKNKFNKTRIESTAIVRKALQKMKNPPKIWISFSSVSCYPKEDDRVFQEEDDIGDDLTASLVKQWEQAADLGEGSPVRTVILRTGLILSKEEGLLSEVVPLFRIGLGSIIGDGSEAFPWIYYKDLCSFLNYVMENEVEQGTYNLVAPQMINSRSFSQALAEIMQRRIFFKLPKRFFQKRLGDVGEIVLAKAKIYPGRILKTGFNFRYPAIYPALVDSFSSNF
ncbi:MAG: Epimerase family protein [Chlamydiae bacterium]|nr:Epimerase family protein [Chlamydiota bacterium]